MNHLEWARDKVLMGPAKKSKIPDPETNNITAYHEAGHTIVRYFTQDADPLHKVTIIPRGQALGFTAHIPIKEIYNRTRSQLLAEMDVMMAGRVAEEQIFGIDKVTTGAASDFSQATKLATNMVIEFFICIYLRLFFFCLNRLNNLVCRIKLVQDHFKKQNKMLV
jgi:ATP-dependent metalloprotease